MNNCTCQCKLGLAKKVGLKKAIEKYAKLESEG